MNGVLRAFWRLLAVLGTVERFLGAALVVVIVLMISVQVVTRYALDQPIVWVEDVATFAFIWASFLGAAAGMKELRHIRIETFVDRLSPTARAVGHALLYAVMLACCVVLARYAWGVMDIEARSSTISLPVNLPRHLFYSVPLFACLASMGLTAVYFILAHLTQAVTGRPVDAQVHQAAIDAHERELDEIEARIAEKSLL